MADHEKGAEENVGARKEVGTEKKKQQQDCSRRTFLTGGAALVTGAAATACLPKVDGQWVDAGTSPCTSPTHDFSIPYDAKIHAGRVVESYDTALTEKTTHGYTVNPVRAAESLKKVLLGVTGAVDLKSAWKMILPETQGKKIGIKVNALNKLYKVVPHPVLVKALVDTLKNDAGLDPNTQIIVWDRALDELMITGLSPTALGCLVEGTEDEVGVKGKSRGYELGSETCIGGWTTRLSTIQTRAIDYLINFAVMKNHSASGYTGCLKNHYGTINNPSNLHGKRVFEKVIPGLNVLPAVAQKARLWLLDATIGICKSDTQDNFDCTPNKVVASLDPLAIDIHGREIRNEEAENKIVEDISQAWIDQAHAIGLGSKTIDLKKVD